MALMQLVDGPVTADAAAGEGKGAKPARARKKAAKKAPKKTAEAAAKSPAKPRKRKAAAA
jgi:hypothetical protein